MGADLVEFVNLAEHTLDIGQTKPTVEALGQLAVVRVHGGLRQAEFTQPFQCVHHDQRELHLIVRRERAVADHVDVGLHELAETPFLRALAPPHLLNLPAFERERQRAGMLHHVPAQRNRQVEVQAEPLFDRDVGFMADLLKTGEQVDLLARLAFLQQTRPLFDGTRFDADEPVELEYLTKRIDDTLLHHAFSGEPFWET